MAGILRLQRIPVRRMLGGWILSVLPKLNRTLSVLLFALPVQVVGNPIRVSVSVQPAVELPIAVDVVCRLDQQSVSASISAPGDVTVAAPAFATCRAIAPHYWAAERTAAAEAVRFVLYKTAQIHGRMLFGSARPAKDLDIAFQNANGGEPAGRTRATIGMDGGWTAEVPVGTLDLRLHAAGFTPHLIWNADTSGASPNVGSLELRTGASLSGRVRAADGASLTDSCRISLVRRSASSNTDQSLRTSSTGSMAVTPSARGFFQIRDVAPGSYDVVVRQAGYAPAIRRNVTVLADSEASLKEPLILERPRTLEVSVIPPLDPWLHEWAVSLFDADTERPMEPEADARLSMTGSNVFSQLGRDRYLIAVRTRSGETWYTQEVTLRSQDDHVVLSVPITPIRGHVRIGEKPVAARLSFGGMSLVRVEMKSDDDGAFTGYLPREGKWQVDIVGEPWIHRSLREVDVRRRDGDESAAVDIVLPATTLRGSVVDSHGEPSGGGYVSVKDASSRIQISVDADGHFRLDGVAAGELTLQATGPGLMASDEIPVRIDDDSPPVVLKLKDISEWEGTVFSAAGPVPGARILAQAANAPTGRVSTASTDAGGRFTLHLLGDASDLITTVFAPGFSLWHARVRAGMPLRVLLDQSGGRVVLEMPHRQGDRPAIPFILHSGNLLPYWQLSQWARLSGGSESVARLALSDMPDGDYVVCAPDANHDYAAFAGGFRSSDRCISGTLAPLSELTLTVP